MRAMEYTQVQRQCQCEPMGRWTLVRFCPIHGTHTEPTKKLTDTECAAEYWRAAHHYLRFEDGDPGQYKAVTQAETWHRFATQPHVSEVEA